MYIINAALFSRVCTPAWKTQSCSKVLKNASSSLHEFRATKPWKSARLERETCLTQRRKLGASAPSCSWNVRIHRCFTQKLNCCRIIKVPVFCRRFRSWGIEGTSGTVSRDPWVLAQKPPHTHRARHAWGAAVRGRTLRHFRPSRVHACSRLRMTTYTADLTRFTIKCIIIHIFFVF